MGQAGAGTPTDRSDDGHAAAAGSVVSHIGAPAPSLVVLHPGAPQQHSQIRSRNAGTYMPSTVGVGGTTCVEMGRIGMGGQQFVDQFVDRDQLRRCLRIFQRRNPRPFILIGHPADAVIRAPCVGPAARIRH